MWIKIGRVYNNIRLSTTTNINIFKNKFDKDVERVENVDIQDIIRELEIEC